LRYELFKRLGPLQAVDTFVFILINQLPHRKLSDRFLTRLSWVMTSGTGWLLFLLLATLVNRRRRTEVSMPKKSATTILSSGVRFTSKELRNGAWNLQQSFACPRCLLHPR
jgi:hypothetical protein